MVLVILFSQTMRPTHLCAANIRPRSTCHIAGRNVKALDPIIRLEKAKREMVMLSMGEAVQGRRFGGRCV